MAQAGTVIVTGGSRGIGAAVCRRLAADGYAIAVNYARNVEQADSVVAAIRSAGGSAHAVAADVGVPEQIGRLFSESIRVLGPLAGLVNNAGITGAAQRLDATEADELRRLFDVNVLGSMLCAKEAVRYLSTGHGGKGGTIVNLGSVAARLGGLSGLSAYAATKGAIESFTRGLASEVAKEGIRVNVVAPGMTATDMASPEMRDFAARITPMGRIGEADEIAEAVAWMMSPASSYVTGSVLTASGGR